ncbi:heme o synthase [Sodalis sp. CWE]|uniref:heme o synthase n=1 Tax=Sodalis sp. CWE TaxID=2803816 RepID=UPI001C7DA415|nr:heme o synthase [Sodalis sp. CWE]MBX4181201.1 protoheme IX farnesyltransferase [Sodalis sp. CWE]
MFIKPYIQVIKLGIVLSNLISAMGGFFLASQGQINCNRLLITLTGMSLIIASGCVFNNYIDRDIDLKMERTKHRAIPNGFISPKICIAYAMSLGITGFSLLYFMKNFLVMWLAIAGFIIYVGIYSLYMKRRSIYSTLIGSVSGATPPVIGYCSISNQFDTCALILLLIFSLWQIPHSYAIAIFRLNDYLAASIPVFPAKHSILVTKFHITLYIIGFMLAALMLTFNGYTGHKYLIVTVLVSLWWLGIALRGYEPINNDKDWARKVFMFSIVVVSSLSIMMSIDFVKNPSLTLYLDAENVSRQFFIL